MTVDRVLAGVVLVHPQPQGRGRSLGVLIDLQGERGGGGGRCLLRGVRARATVPYAAISIVLDALGRCDERRVLHLGLGVFLDRLLALGDQAMHGLAGLLLRLLAQQFEDLLKPRDLVLGLGQVLLEGRRPRRIERRAGPVGGGVGAAVFPDGWIRRAEASGVEQMARALDSHRDGLPAYYDAFITSGPLEGADNKIKTMKRQAYGFRDQELFKLKILALHETRHELVG